MLCYRCGSHVPDGSAQCTACGQKLSAAKSRGSGAFTRRKAISPLVEGAPFQPNDLVASRFRIKDTLGAGPLGFVFRAHDQGVDVEIALKVIAPNLVQTDEERKAFSQTLKAARKLTHTNLAQLYEDGEFEGRTFYTSQHLEGLSLRRIIDLRREKGQYFTLKEIEPIFGQIANGLDAAHKHGAHGDLKPDNVIVLPDLLKLTDFALGRAIPRKPFVEAQRTREAHRYLAPEFQSTQEIDGRADIYALGVILGEMVAGVFPDGGTPELRAHNPELPPELQAVYGRAVAESGLGRFPSAGELHAEIASLARRGDSRGKRPSSPPRPPPEAATPRRARALELIDPPAAAPSPSAAAAAAPAEPAESPAARSTLPFGSTAPDVAARTTLRFDPSPPSPTATTDPAGPPEGAVEEAARGTSPRAAFESITEHEITVPGTPWRDEKGYGRPPDRNRGRRKRSRMPVVALGLLGLAVGVGAVFAWSTLQHAKPSGATASADTGTAASAKGPPELAPWPSEGPKLPPSTPAAVDAGTPKAAQGTAVAPPVVAAAAAAPAPTPAPTPAATAAATAAPPPSASQAVAAKAEPVSAPAKAPPAAAPAEPAGGKPSARREELAKAFPPAETPRAAAAPDEEEEDDAPEAAPEKPVADKTAKLASTAAGASKGLCPSGMRLIASGAFKMGSARDDPMMGFDEKTLTSTEVGTYCIDLYEYPNRAGAAPLTGLSYLASESACRSRGKRLCTEEEWERACKGPNNARFPYGNQFNADLCNTQDGSGGDRSVAQSGSFSRCVSAYGIVDMSGNVAEWTSSKYSDDAPDRTLKGGSADRPDYDARCASRKNASPSSSGEKIGFRCCADPG